MKSKIQYYYCITLTCRTLPFAAVVFTLCIAIVGVTCACVYCNSNTQLQALEVVKKSKIVEVLGSEAAGVCAGDSPPVLSSPSDSFRQRASSASTNNLAGSPQLGTNVSVMLYTLYVVALYTFLFPFVDSFSKFGLHTCESPSCCEELSIFRFAIVNKISTTTTIIAATMTKTTVSTTTMTTTTTTMMTLLH